MTNFLDEDVFGLIVASTPLISIDLVVRSPQQKILLGKRLNRPAQGSWFVPGGRIYKNEMLDLAFSRIVRDELDLKLQRRDVKFLNVFEHFYKDSQFGMSLADTSTHYIVLAHELHLNEERISYLPKTQHQEYKWWDIIDLIKSDDVHQHTKNYFLNHKN